MAAVTHVCVLHVNDTSLFIIKAEKTETEKESGPQVHSKNTFFFLLDKKNPALCKILPLNVGNSNFITFLKCSLHYINDKKNLDTWIAKERLVRHRDLQSELTFLFVGSCPSKLL